MSQTETITSTQEIYAGRTVTLNVHQVRLDDGRESVREIVEHRGAVAVVALTETGDVLMIRQFRLATGHVLLELPAGTLEPGEDPRDAAFRELEEETGYRAVEMEELGAFFVSPGWCTEKIRVYLARGLTESAQALDEDEVVETLRLPFTDALARCERGDIQDGKSLTGLLLAAKRLGVS